MKYLIMHGSYGSPDENWFRWLEEELKTLGHEVILEQFPVDDWNEIEKVGSENIDTYTPVESLSSWEEYFVDHILPQIKNQEIGFVGHSIAPIFMLHMLVKYDIKIKTAIFVSPFFNIPDAPNIWQFYPVNKTFYSYDFDFEKIKAKIGESFVVYGDNDPYVPASEPPLFAEKLGSEIYVVPGGRHCGSNFIEFPLLIELVKQKRTLQNQIAVGAKDRSVFEKLKITNKRNLNLSTVIGYPSKDQRYPAIVLLHGFTGYKDEEHIVELAKYLTESGYVTVRFDCSGFAESEGSTDVDYRLSNYYSDIESVFEYVKTLEFVDVQKLGIWGNSLGGTLALCFASKNPWIKVVCTVSAPTQFARKDNFERRTKSWEQMGYFEKESSRYGHIKIPYEFVVDSQKWNALDSVSNIKVPSLYIVGKADENVFPDNTKELFVKANEPKQFVEIEGMNHFYKKVPDQIAQVNEAVSKFIKEYL